MQKIAHFIFDSRDRVNFRVPWQSWLHPFLTKPPQNFLINFYFMWIFCQYAKKSGYFVNLCYRYVWLKNPAIWLAENILDHIFRTTISQIRDLYRNTANKINFHYRTNSVKIKTPILAHFHSIFSPIFGGNKMFLEIPAQSRTISYGFLAPCQNLENAWTDKRTEGRTEDYFIGSFRLTPDAQIGKLRLSL